MQKRGVPWLGRGSRAISVKNQRIARIQIVDSPGSRPQHDGDLTTIFPEDTVSMMHDDAMYLKRALLGCSLDSVLVFLAD
jgi:hypothetical protein